MSEARADISEYVRRAVTERAQQDQVYWSVRTTAAMFQGQIVLYVQRLDTSHPLSVVELEQ